MGKTQDDFAAVCFSPPPPPSFLVFLRPLISPSSCPPSFLPPSPPGFLDAEQTQCSLCKITRLINANKQTTALRQPQMKANLYAINRGRSSFNLPARPARCRCSTPPPPPSFTAVLCLSCPPPRLPLPPPRPPACSLSQSLPCCWAGLKGKEN